MFDLQYILTIGWSFEALFWLVFPDIWKIMVFPAVPRLPPLHFLTTVVYCNED
jgi:hypothetical protein